MLSRRRLRCYQSEMDLSSSAAALLAGDVPVQVRHFPLRGGEKLLELVLEGQIAGARSAAIMLANMYADAKVLLGTATPSMAAFGWFLAKSLLRSLSLCRQPLP